MLEVRLDIRVSVMEADKEEQRGVVGFLNAERVRGREIYRRTSSCG